MMLLVDGQCGPNLLDTAQQTEESQDAINERLKSGKWGANVHHHRTTTTGAIDHGIDAGRSRNFWYKRPSETVRCDIDLRL